MEIVSADALKGMLLSEIAGHLQIEPDELDPTASVFDLGVNSVWIVQFIGRLEDTLGFEISPDMLWDYESIDALAGYLYQESTSRKDAKMV